MTKQTFTVKLEAELARRAMHVVNLADRGYGSFEELVAVALENQLGAETEDGASPVAEREPGAPPHALLVRPRGEAPIGHLVGPTGSNAGLFILTNRLSPLKVATRVLANLHPLVGRLGDQRRWPTVKTFRATAGHAARALGFDLQRRDRAASVAARDKRATGYPVGRDERASFDRFAVSFTIGGGEENPSGPLAVLGLASVVDGDRVALTETGWRLAMMASPLLDDDDDDDGVGDRAATLSDDERRLLLQLVANAPGERAAIVELLRLVDETDGLQTAVDEQLGNRHPDWSTNRAMAHRSAIVGRLRELELLAVSGRGLRATLQIRPDGREFVESYGTAAEATAE